MASKIDATVKTLVRGGARRLGWEIVPLSSGLTPLQLSLLAECKSVLDVGANVGQFAERLRDLGWSDEILSFEPGTSAYNVLLQKSRKDAAWQVRQCALGSREGTGELLVSAADDNSSLLPVQETHLEAAPQARTVSSERVRLSTLDKELETVNRGPYYLKLDVQGFELEVLRGAAKTLSETRAVQVEVSFASSYAGGADWRQLLNFLEELGFEVWFLEPGLQDRKTGRLLQADFLMVRQEAGLGGVAK